MFEVLLVQKASGVDTYALVVLLMCSVKRQLRNLIGFLLNERDFLLSRFAARTENLTIYETLNQKV